MRQLSSMEIDDAVRKMTGYRNSRYLNRELEAFCHIMAETELLVRDCEAFHRVFSVFEGKIKAVCLPEKEYLELVGGTVRGGRGGKEERTRLVLDLEPGSRYALSETPGTARVYSLGRFMVEFAYLVENEEFSRMIRITETAQYRLRDFVSDLKMEEIKFQRNSLLTKYFYEYMTENNIPVLLTETGSISSIQASCEINGVRGSAADYIGFIFCDLIDQQRILSETLPGRKIHVLNVMSAVNAPLTEGERKRFENQGSPEALLKEEDYESLELLYQGDCEKGKAEEYAGALSYRWPLKRRFENDLILFADYDSAFVKIENGLRRTCCQPEGYLNTIYFTGPCFAFGPFVEDRHTIPSLVSEMLVKEGYSYRVVNLGLLASNEAGRLLDCLALKEGDIVINMIYNENEERIRGIFGDVIDPGAEFDEVPDRGEMFFDKCVHCNRKGNERYARAVYEGLRKICRRRPDAFMVRTHSYDIFRKNPSDLGLYGFEEYTELLRKESAKIPPGVKKIGSIVMNCNPFTLGHRCLVEYALGECAYLFVFVVQEDKSYFRFADRLAMAAANCRVYENVSVVPSGSMIASDITFPEYFKREKDRDQNGGEDNVTITPVSDLRIFASYIAPLLGIGRRFIAEEPFDSVTRQYNEYMKEILPALQVEVVEIPRKTLASGEVVSASRVRELYRSRRYVEMREMLSEETYDYLMKKSDEYLGKGACGEGHEI